MSSVNIKRRMRPGARFVIGVPFVWLSVLVLATFVIVFKISFADQTYTIPPFTPLFDEKGALQLFTKNYQEIFTGFGRPCGRSLPFRIRPTSISTC